MADKETALSIVIRTVDKATAGIQAINKKLDAATKPAREFGEALSKFGEKSGFNSVVEGFKGVGEGVKEALWKVVEVGAVVGEVTHLVLEMAESFAKLGHTAQKDGVTVDFLASMRYAAQKAGLSVDQLDQGMTTFGENLGQARANMGRMTKFLGGVSPALLSQLKAAKSNQAAFLLLADAMAKVTDPSKRLALAQKTVGDSALAVVLAKGSKELIKQQGAYAKLAGSQDEAAKGGIEIEDAMVDLKAASDGVEAALVVGLAPALKEIIDRMQEWVVDHRADIERWAEDIGKKLPGAVDAVVDAVKRAVDKVSWLVDKFGGANLAIGALAAVIVGPLVASFASLSLAMLGSPFGWVVVSLAAITAGVVSLVVEIDKLKDALDTSHETMLEDSVNLSPEAFEKKYPAFAGEKQALAQDRAGRATLDMLAPKDKTPDFLKPLPLGPLSTKRITSENACDKRSISDSFRSTTASPSATETPS